MMARAQDDQASSALGAWARRLDLDRRVEPFQDNRWHGNDQTRPVLHLEDVSAIPFLSGIAGVEEYQHRARGRTQNGDLYATVTSADPVYEHYCRERLGFGDARWLAADRGDDPLAVARACQEAPTFERIVHVTRQSGGLAIHPYMAIDDVWNLATQVAAAADAPRRGDRPTTARHVGRQRQGGLLRARRRGARAGLDPGDPPGGKPQGDGHVAAYTRRTPSHGRPQTDALCVGDRQRGVRWHGGRRPVAGRGGEDGARVSRTDRVARDGTGAGRGVGGDPSLAIDPVVAASPQCWSTPSGRHVRTDSRRRHQGLRRQSAISPSAASEPNACGGREADRRGVAEPGIRRSMLLRPSGPGRSGRRLRGPLHRVQRPVGRHEHFPCTSSTA